MLRIPRGVVLWLSQRDDLANQDGQLDGVVLATGVPVPALFQLGQEQAMD
jgi:TRAP-type uncharacterized transport system substrate-binding protein